MGCNLFVPILAFFIHQISAAKDFVGKITWSLAKTISYEKTFSYNVSHFLWHDKKLYCLNNDEESGFNK